MLVASDTSPISNLAIIGRLDLLRTQFGEIWIPAAVESELGHLPHPLALASVRQALREGWIKVRAASGQTHPATSARHAVSGNATTNKPP